ncbi:S-adenosyl-L-methionine-dependent methyltransferase [Mortierella sp. GBAus27b]|nr:hypothetical protein BGX31_009902 [Mortierella sp. GBA43]KAI8346618.1 S-adenosyl-L-methionine-dependent methyltransferase [Mortierella sp. GBAus27b]
MSGGGPGHKNAPFRPELPRRVPAPQSFSSGMQSSSAGRDDVIKGTDDDAITSKLSAVDLGYLDDPFVKHFVKRPSRRPPIINRGSYLRTATLDNLTIQFINSTIEAGSGSAVTEAKSCATTNTTATATTTTTTTTTSTITTPSTPASKSDDTQPPSSIKKQIVSLGCGSDTRYFKLKAKGLSVHKYFEIDFQESTAKKAAVIKKNKALTDIIGDPDLKLGQGGTELYSTDYDLLSGDLREFESSLVPKLKARGFDTSLPTLFLSECVLIYIQPRDSDAIVEWVRNNMDASLFVVYEQINPTDPFGAMMLRNLKARQIELPGIHAYPSLKSQEERFLSRGWLAAKAVTMNVLYNILEEDEVKRTSNLEIFDEVEEWQLLADHYCVAWAYHARAHPQPAKEHYREQLITLLFNSVHFLDRK